MGTKVGTQLSVTLAGRILPGTLQFSQIKGTWLQGLILDDVIYSDGKTKMHLKDAHITWSINSSRQLTIFLNHSHIQLLQVDTKNNVAKSDKAVTFQLPSIPFSIEINELLIDQLNIDGITLNHIFLQASLTPQHLNILELKFNYEKQQVALKAIGQLTAPYTITSVLRVSPKSSAKDGLAGNIRVTGNKDCYRWQGAFQGALPITFQGTLIHLSELKTELSLAQNKMIISGTIPNQLSLTASISNPASLHPALSGLKTNIHMSGQLNHIRYGKFSVVIEPGMFQLPKDSALPMVPFQGGTLDIDLTPKGLHASGLFTLNTNQSIEMSLLLPKFNGQDIAHQTLEGKLNLQVNSLDFLQGINPYITKPHGKLLATLEASGVIGDPKIQGKIDLSNAGLSIPDAGIVLNAIQASLVTRSHHWELKGIVQEESGQSMKIEGEGELSPYLLGKIQINAEHFLVFNTPEYSMNISPQIELFIKPDALDITGTIEIPKARLKPIVLSNTSNLSHDIVYVREDSTKKSKIISVNTNVSIKIGDDVILDIQGLHAILAGGLQLKQIANGSMSAIGAIAIREGTYKAYGQDLTIDHGEFLFSGGTLTNPKINLRAARSFNNTSQFSGSDQLFDFSSSNLQSIDFGNHLTVGVQVMGSLDAPKVKLYSVPASLSQADILSLLILGKPANQANQSGAQLLLTAASAMNLDSGSKGMELISQLKQTLGVDLDIQNNTNPNNSTGDNTSLVISKSLSKRLYLSYNIGILQENSNVLTLKYLLNKYFSVQVTTSSLGNGLDVLYTGQVK